MQEQTSEDGADGPNSSTNSTSQLAGTYEAKR